MSTRLTSYPLHLVSNETVGAHAWHPAFDLGHPVGERRLGSNDQVWSWRVSIVLHVAQERHGLQRLA